MKRQRAAVMGKKKRLGSLSIAARLTLLYALSAFAMLAAASGFLLWVLASSLDREDTEFISDEVEGFRAQLAAKHQDDALFREEAAPGQASRSPQFYLRLLRSNGQTERETPGMDALSCRRAFLRRAWRRRRKTNRRNFARQTVKPTGCPRSGSHRAQTTEAIRSFRLR